MSETEDIGQLIWARLNAYREHSQTGQGPVLTQMPAQDLAQDLQLKNWIEQGGLNADTVDRFLEPYLKNTQHMHHPGYIGHQVAVPHIGASLAEMIHGVTNNPMAVYEMGPAASVIERVIINWMLEKIGWYSGAIDDFEANEDQGAGILTHGGSLANLTALLAARACVAPHAWEEGVPDNLAVIAPAATHYSLARAVSIAGLGQNAIYYAPVSDLEVLRPETLEAVHAKAEGDGKTVFMISANACTTATGLYDPIDEVADFCQSRGIWFHVDGAHGGSALLSSKEKHLLKGVARADSFIWDAHKMMRTSALCAAVLFKKQRSLVDAFRQQGSYIFYGEDQPGFDIGPYTVECTKAPLGTKLFWVLAMEGEAKLGAFVDKQYSDTRAFHDLINAEPDFSCPYVPEANILCFHYDPVEEDARQLALRTEITRRGNFYITSAEICGRRYLRLSVMNPLTTVETIKSLLEEIRVCATLV
ncbi:MAG: diaminobutyrate decarboxylase [Robiginitomaculum sp.]|nr:MAG: diaminobutyrate decarboxylase [Robiginitomaculum sp.]